MNHVPEEITIDELPSFGQNFLTGRRTSTGRPIVGSQRNSLKGTLPVLKTDDSTGRTIYFQIINVFEKTEVWITNRRKIDVYYHPSKYIQSPDDVHKIAIVIGLGLFDKAVRENNYELDDDLIKILFEKDTAIYFLSKDSKRLFASAFETNQQKHGPLQPILAMKALENYGIGPLEEAIERGIATVNG